MAVRVGGQVGKAQLSHPGDQGTLPRQSTSCKDQGAEAEWVWMLPGLVQMVSVSLPDRVLWKERGG